SVILTNAKSINKGLKILEQEWTFILKALESESLKHLIGVITDSAARLQTIPMKRPLDEVPVISLVGEIFVRRDSISRRFLTQQLAKNGFAVACAPVTEWFLYIDLMLSKGFLKKKLSKFEMLEALYRKKYMAKYEKVIQTIFKKSGIYHGHSVNIQSIIDCASPFIPMDLAGEGILTVGSSLMNIASSACGVIAIGPFGCMPNRISEAILNKTMNQNQKIHTDPDNHELKSVLTNMDHLPFLAIESDGRPFPQIIEAKLETFLLRAMRLHNRMIEKNSTIENDLKNNIRIPLHCD
ncbi:MAG: activase, partial [Desulfobacteraceae bacterium]|nr:activase [Desulfobacteraceae bacterium]